jgi:hypothetical protein
MNDAVEVEVHRSGRRFEAEALLDLVADAQTVWGTITDYGSLARFMPGIRACRVIERHVLSEGAERLVVEQLGEFRFLLSSQALKVMLDIDHQPLRVAHARAVSFDIGLFKRRAIDAFEGRYELECVNARHGSRRTQLRYRALIGLRPPPPPAIGSMAVRQNLAAQLEAVAQEVARRSGCTTPAPASR